MSSERLFWCSVSADNDLLVRTTIESELSIEYDVTARISVLDIFNWWREEHSRPSSHLQFDYGFGIGMTGFRVADDVSTDVRFRTDPASTFNDLAPGATVSSASSSSFTAPFWSLHYTFRVSDEFQVGFDTRYYQEDQASDSEIAVDDVTFSLNALWYPTFNW